MSAIELHLDPKQAPMEWEAFEAWAPPFSIDLDGFVWVVAIIAQRHR